MQMEGLSGVIEIETERERKRVLFEQTAIELPLLLPPTADAV